MIDRTVETLVALQNARDSIPGKRGQRVSISTLHRWHRHGLRGTRLETVLVAGVRYTSAEAIDRFIRATTQAADDDQQATETRQGVADAK